MQGVIFAFDLLQVFRVQFVQRGQEEQMICFSSTVRLLKLRMRIMLVKFLGSQFYIDVMAADAEILKVTAGDVKARFLFAPLDR